MGVIHKFSDTDCGFRWDDVQLESYQSAAKDVTKQVLIGRKEGAEHFRMRYYEIAPGGTSSFDHHKHDHGVIVLRGRGRVLLGGELHEIKLGDAIYIPPYEDHQFENTGAEPLGFICVIPPKK